MTITSVNPFPLLVKFKDCYFWPNGLFMGRIPRDPRVLWFEIPTSIFIHFFKNIFMRFLRWIPFWLIIDDMIGWQKAERSDPTESDWVIISSHIFEKRILSIQNDFMVISDLIFALKLTLKIYPFRVEGNFAFVRFSLAYRFFKLIKNDESFNMTKRFVGTSLEFKKCWLI